MMAIHGHGMQKRPTRQEPTRNAAAQRLVYYCSPPLGTPEADPDKPQDLWPLQLLNPSDDEQMSVLYGLLGTLPHVVQHYLEQLAFPLTMQHQAHKLSANGQDLGSSSLFGSTRDAVG